MNRNAFIGRNAEQLFKNSIGDQSSILGKIISHFKIKGVFEGALSTGIHGEKSDIKMGFSDGRNVDANIKAFKASGPAFNQITRTTISKFCEIFNLLELKSTLTDLFLEKSRNSRTKTFPDNIQSHLISIFQPISRQILSWSFSYKKSREILVLFEQETGSFLIYPMKEVLQKINKEISFTTRGNIQIGNCVIIQRKGGNGVHSLHIPKDDIKHPGNNIQIKLKMKIFISEMERILLAKYRL
ncbi:MAG: hypothetical protein KDC73_04930 [Ignavibacteriae bacterium]|nr:hypothetical protein [Ignavibacteriota bacterium]MCB9243933.1 hypothetical protein [Ignavibacteriales bacterium]